MRYWHDARKPVTYTLWLVLLVFALNRIRETSEPRQVVYVSLADTVWSVKVDSIVCAQFRWMEAGDYE